MSMPSRTKIVAAQMDTLLPSLPLFEWYTADAHYRCWGCGYASDGSWALERAHIDARCNKGGDAPTNFFLLCARCHRDQPDGAGREEQIAWITSRERWTDRMAREARPVLERLAVVAGSYSDLVRWHRTAGTEAMYAALSAGANKTASARSWAANAEAELTRVVRDWSASQCGPEAPAGSREAPLGVSTALALSF